MALSRQDQLHRLTLINAIFSELLQPDIHPHLHADVREQIETGINKAYGQAEAFFHEYMTYKKAANKGREIMTQLRGDVTIGKESELNAKTVECKNVTAPTKAAVTEQIVKALYQLGGGTGHMPRAEDVRVADIRIAWRDCRWPFTDQGHSDYGVCRTTLKCTEEQVRMTALAEIKAQFAKPEAKAVRDWLLGDQTPGAAQIMPLGGVVFNGHAAPAFPKSARPVALHADGSVTKVRSVIVKVRYEVVGFITEMLGDHVTDVYEITIAVTRKQGVHADLEFRAQTKSRSLAVT